MAITQLLQANDLLWAWTARTVRGRYQQSALGWLWAIIQPAASVVIMTIVFTWFVPIDTGDIPYPIFLFTSVVPWTFFASSLNDMTGSVVGNMSLVTKIYFPREVLPIASMLARLLDFGVAAAFLIIVMVIYRIYVNPMSLLYIPVILAIQMALILGVGLACAAANVFYRDVQSFLTLGIQLWFYATPILYPATMVPDQLWPIYFLNPMAGVIVAYRDVLLNGQMPGWYLLPSALVAIFALLGGYWFFKRVEFTIADII